MYIVIYTGAELGENDKFCVAVGGVGWRGASGPHQLDDVRMATQLFLWSEKREKDRRKREGGRQRTFVKYSGVCLWFSGKYPGS